MSSSKVEILSIYDLMYLPAVLHKNAAMGWIVEYYVMNPGTNTLERRRFRLNKLRKRYPTLSSFKVAANDIVVTINNRLAGGWTPFGESENSRYYMQLDMVLRLYLREKQKEVREATYRCYSSFVNLFSDWVSKNVPSCKCIDFKHLLAVRYMDYFYDAHSSHARTYNNQLKMARAFFSWAKEKCYVKENPFELIKVKREPPKRRVIIPSNYRSQIALYFEQHCPTMNLVSRLVYTSLIRPVEISRITVGMVNVEKHYIHLPAEITKNGNARFAPLDDELCAILKSYISGSANDLYLIGPSWHPEKTAMASKRFTKWWIKMRSDLKIPDEMQLYSLRDTGITDKLKSGIDALTVMQAADHQDLSMTTRYCKHYDPNMVNTISEMAPKY